MQWLPLESTHPTTGVSGTWADPLSSAGRRVLWGLTSGRRPFPRGHRGTPSHALGMGLPLPQRRPQTRHLLFNLYLQTLRSDEVPETLDGVICSPCPPTHFWGWEGMIVTARPLRHPSPPPPQLCN